MSEMFSPINQMQQGLDFHLVRQNLLASNVANVDTPGFAPKELTRGANGGNTEFSLTLMATDQSHLRGVSGASDAGFKVHEEHNAIPGNDLNYVSLDTEMARLGANSLRYQAVSKLVSKHLGILSYAVNDGRG